MRLRLPVPVGRGFKLFVRRRDLTIFGVHVGVDPAPLLDTRRRQRHQSIRAAFPTRHTSQRGRQRGISLGHRRFRVLPQRGWIAVAADFLQQRFQCPHIL